MTPLPEPRLRHLAQLTDAIGLREHAEHERPRPEHGYCVDDAARALVVLARTAPSPLQAELLHRNLAFVAAARRPDGGFVNRAVPGGAWIEGPTVGDWWGRAVWGLATVATHAPDGDDRAHARQLVRPALLARTRHPRAMAHAALGAALLAPDPVQGGAARRLLRDAVAALDAYLPGQRWRDGTLTYANGVLPHALLAAGDVLDDRGLVAAGLRLLDRLLVTQIRDGHLSVTPVGGRGPADPAPGFDQQPIEVHHLAEAAATAFDVTGDERWLEVVHLAAAWFLGDNDVGVAMYDPATGAGFDGLTATGRNDNRGAESTLAALATLQLARGAAARQSSVDSPGPRTWISASPRRNCTASPGSSGKKS